MAEKRRLIYSENGLTHLNQDADGRVLQDEFRSLDVVAQVNRWKIITQRLWREARVKYRDNLLTLSIAQIIKKRR